MGKKRNWMQGDTYELPVILKDQNGLLDIALIAEVEFMFNGLRKLYPEQVSYDAKAGVFIVPFTQEETLSMNGKVKRQSRIVFVDGTVKGTDVYYEDVTESLSKVVL